MAATRAVLLRTGIVPDVGTMSLIVTAAAVAGPFAIAWLAERTGARFLFERQAFLHLAGARRPARAIAAE
jgi:hypothetical protein